MKLSVLFAILLLPQLSFAAAYIEEVMYDPEGADTDLEWIEVCSRGSDIPNFVDWRFFEGSSSHRFTAVTGGNALPADSCAVIAHNADAFRSAFSAFSGILFDSSFSLGNTGETLVIRTPDSTDSDSITYSSSQGAQGDGKSLVRSGASFVAAMPTPGVSNGAGTPVSASSNSTTTSDGDVPQVSLSSYQASNREIFSSHMSPVRIYMYEHLPEFEVSAGRKRLAAVGAPVRFESEILKQTGGSGRYVWTFGDGAAGKGKVVDHAYLYPGTYEVVLNAASDKEAVSRTTVEVFEPKVAISAVTDGYVEIRNDSAYELNLAGWSLQAGERSFSFPQDTILAPSRSVKMPRSLLAFGFGGLPEVRVVDPSSVVQAALLEGGGSAGNGAVVAELERSLLIAKRDLALLKAKERSENLEFVGGAGTTTVEISQKETKDEGVVGAVPKPETETAAVVSDPGILNHLWDFITDVF